MVDALDLEGEFELKPLIGICTNYSTEQSIGQATGLGLQEQEWHLLADDYISVIEKAGGIPVILPLTESNETRKQLLGKLDGILFTGGSDIDPQQYGELPRYGLGSIAPQRDQHEIELAKMALYETTLPILGVCRGMQLLNVVSGGTLYQDLKRDKPEGINHLILASPKYHPVHPVTMTPSSKFHQIFNAETIGVNSYHHQAIKEIGKGFEATMLAPDGIIEGIELEGERFVCAVQWHPEMMVDHMPEIAPLFTSFVNASAKVEMK